MSGYHARKPPSGAKRWGGHNGCTASVKAQDGIPSLGNTATYMGTCGHQMCAEMLLNPAIDPQSYLGMEMVFWVHPETNTSGEDWAGHIGPGRSDPTLEVIATHTVDQELLDLCITHVEYVRERVALTGGRLYVEQSVPIDHITCEKGATGSLDVGIVYGDTVEIIDLKLGRGAVNAYEVVSPTLNEPNEQLAMYASGLILQEGLFNKHIILTISQPTLNRISQWSGSMRELNHVLNRLVHMAQLCDINPTFNPTHDNCHFCRASGNCTAQTEMVARIALDGFDDVGTAQPAAIQERSLGDLYAVVPLVQDWCAAVVERARNALTAGEPVTRSDGLSYKLVKGKAGARKWADEQQAAQAMFTSGLPNSMVYEQSIISPTTAEKLATPKKAKKGEKPVPPALAPDHWSKLQELIIQGEGQPQIVLETDPRPALSQTDGFDDVPPNQDLF